MTREWLTTIRNSKMLTQQTISNDINISQQYYSHIENGTRTPSTEVAKKIAKSLDFEWTKFYE